MRMLLLIAMLALTANLVPVHAQQLSKEEAKEWKNKAKDYRRNPAALKRLSDDVDRYRQEAQEYAVQLNELEAEKANRRAQLAQLERDNVRLQDQLAETRNAMLDVRNQDAQPALGDDMRGLVFRVQIGAYEKLAMPDNLNNEGDNMDLYMEDGLQKIIIGKFRDIGGAEALRSYMQKIGIKDAWVVAYQDGARVPVNSVVPGYGQ